MHEYNAAAQDAEDDFDPRTTDDIRTRGDVPEKTNWGIKLMEPPFAADSARRGINFSFGRLKMNDKTQVIPTG